MTILKMQSEVLYPSNASNVSQVVPIGKASPELNPLASVWDKLGDPQLYYAEIEKSNSTISSHAPGLRSLTIEMGQDIIGAIVSSTVNAVWQIAELPNASTTSIETTILPISLQSKSVLERI